MFTTATPAEWRKTKREAKTNRPTITAVDMLRAQAVKFDTECWEAITRIAEIYEAEGFDRVVNINVTSPYGEQIGVLKVTA